MFKELDIFFTDWSGVISDDRRPVYESNCRMCKQFGITAPSYEEWLPATTAGPQEFFKAHGVKLSGDEIFDLYTKTFKIVNQEGLRPIPYKDAQDFLKRVSQQCPVIVVSAHPKTHLTNEARGYGLMGCIDQLEGGVREKHTAIGAYHSILHGSPWQAAFIGDTIYDIRAGKKAGVKTIGITTGYHTRAQLEAEKPDLIVDSLSELLVHF